MTPSPAHTTGRRLAALSLLVRNYQPSPTDAVA